MRPPWASTIPLQMARPRPASPPDSVCSRRKNLRNRSGRSSAGIPRPWSDTEISTLAPAGTALTRMTESSRECSAALESRLPTTWTMRLRSAITRGRSGVTSMTRSFLPPALMKAFRARSTRAATSTGSGSTDSVPVSMWVTSSRSPMSSRIWSARSMMIRWNWRISAGSRS